MIGFLILGNGGIGNFSHACPGATSVSSSVITPSTCLTHTPLSVELPSQLRDSLQFSGILSAKRDFVKGGISH